MSDFTYVATWKGFKIDVCARYILGWPVSHTAHAGFVLDALEQSFLDNRPIHRGRLIHHTDREGNMYR